MIINVKTSSPYDVIIERGILEKSGEFIKPLFRGEKIAIITDSKVHGLYAESLWESLDIPNITFVFEHGEQSKNVNILNEIYQFLAYNNITRTDAIVALGGGVTGDMAGYAAATWLRGIDYFQIPTTLLAQIDSSVGGKTAIDLPQGKNLVGAFKQPKLVLADPNVLKTLDENVLADGMAEAIKYGMIKDKTLFEKINSYNINNILENIDDIIVRCVEIKRDVVVADEFEKGERMLLNFGHTLGHAVEQLSNFTIPHGSAVAIGMVMITEKYANHLTEPLKDCLLKYNLPVSASFPIDKILKISGCDKKRAGSKISYIVCNKVGESEIRKSEFSEFFK